MSRTPRRAFTLVELLVVVAIIVILIAILVPSLEKAMANAQRMKCGSNLSGIGKGLAVSLNDSISRQYPSIREWWNLLGDPGTYSTDPNAVYKDSVDQRPLNKYLGYMGTSRDPNNTPTVPIAECPSDTGSPYGPSTNVYAELGTSYLAPFLNHSGVQAVFSTSGGMAAASIRPSANKWMVFDTIALSDSSIAERKNRWHTSAAERRVNILYADSHVELTLVPLISGTGDSAVDSLSVNNPGYYPWDGKPDGNKHMWW